MNSDADRDRLRRSFDSKAEFYDHARPEYPVKLFDHLVTTAAISPGDHLLEVGCATGKATRPLAQRGFAITCVELGEQLAGVAKRNLQVFPDVAVVNEPFESWNPPEDISFALVFAATAWHWIEPEVRYQRAFELLRPNGHLAFWSAGHVFPEGGDPFFADIQDVYDEIQEGRSPSGDWPRPGELPDERASIEDSGLFEVVSIKQFDWEVTYDADAYIALLDTFSDHISMRPEQREHLYSEIRRRRASRPTTSFRRHWGAVLHIARKL